MSCQRTVFKRALLYLFKQRLPSFISCSVGKGNQCCPIVYKRILLHLLTSLIYREKTALVYVSKLSHLQTLTSWKEKWEGSKKSINKTLISPADKVLDYSENKSWCLLEAESFTFFFFFSFLQNMYVLVYSSSLNWNNIY